MSTQTVLSFRPEPKQRSPRPQGGGQGAGIKSSALAPLHSNLPRGGDQILSPRTSGAIHIAPSFPRKRESINQTSWIPCLAPLARNDTARRCYKSSALAPRHSNLPWRGDQDPQPSPLEPRSSHSGAASRCDYCSEINRKDHKGHGDKKCHSGGRRGVRGGNPESRSDTTTPCIRSGMTTIIENPANRSSLFIPVL